MTRKRFAAIVSLLCIAALAAVLYVIAANLNHQRTRSIALQKPPTYQRQLMNADIDETHQLNKPLDVYKHKDLVYVLDGSSQSIKVYKEDGTFVREMKISDDDLQQKAYPVSLAIDESSESIFVAEPRNAHVKVYGLNGEDKGEFPEKNSPVQKPVAVTTHDGLLYIADAGKQKIVVFKIATGELLREFGEPGTEPGQFMFPTGIAVRDNGDVCIADSNNKRIQVFDGQGQFREVLKHTDQGFFALPRDLAIDNQGYMHVVDALNHSVCVFDTRGEFMFCYGQTDEKGELLTIPNGIFIDRDNFEIYVADQGSQQVLVFGYGKI